MQTHYKQLTDSQWQVMKTSLPIQSAPKASLPQRDAFGEGMPLAWEMLNFVSRNRVGK